MIGLSARRSLPHYAEERFDKWFVKHCRASVSDAMAFTETPYSSEAPSFFGTTRLCVTTNHTSELPRSQCWKLSGSRFRSQRSGAAADDQRLAREISMLRRKSVSTMWIFSHQLHNASPARTSNTPILFLEPSCWSMFVEDYRELRIENAEKIANRCFLFEKFVDDLLEQEPELCTSSIHPPTRRATADTETKIVIHPHCHAKSIMNPAFMRRLAERLPGRKATVLETGCCGMAGAFGALAEKYDLSLQVAEDLIDKIEDQPRGTADHRLRDKLPTPN